MKDRQELYLSGEDIIKFGEHHFSVNRKKNIDLSIVQKDGKLFYHITGTDYWDEVKHEGIDTYKHVFEQSLVSENVDVYRGEYLAYTVFEAAKNKVFEDLDVLHAMSVTQLVEAVRTFMEKKDIRKGTQKVYMMKMQQRFYMPFLTCTIMWTF